MVPNLQLIANGKGFPQYLGNDVIGKVNNFTDTIKNLGSFNDDEAFYYTYTILHSREYKKKYEHDLIKAFPRIPLLKNTSKFIEIGKQLVNLHINYETVNAFKDIVIESVENPSYKV